MSHGIQQSVIDMLAPHQDGTMLGWRYNDATRSLVKTTTVIYSSP